MKLLDRIIYDPVAYSLRLVLVIFFALLILGVCAKSAYAKQPSMVYQDSRMTVTLINDACLNPKVLSQIEPKHHGFFRAGNVIWEGKPIGMCWAFTQDGYIHLQDETGDSGVLPVGVFKGALEV